MSDNWVCLDDDKADVVEPLLEGIRAADRTLVFVRWRPEALDTLLARFEREDPDGVLVDLRLDEVANDAGERVAFRGLTFAQELRTRMTENAQRPIPIVLWSVDGKLKSSYAGDNTGHDLADRVYVKDSDIVDSADRVAAEMSALREGYKSLRPAVSETGHFWELLGLAKEEVQRLDDRIIEGMLVRERQVAHEWASLIIRELLERPGPLIDEAVVAARLGVDQTCAGWPVLWNRLRAECGYEGVFGTGWARVWMHRLLDWWSALIGDASDLQRLDAAERVAALKDHAGVVELVAAEPIAPGYSSRFWTVCRGHKRPLDPVDGVVALVPELRAWQDKYYLSLDAALKRVGRNEGWRPELLELPRLRAAEAQAEAEVESAI